MILHAMQAPDGEQTEPAAVPLSHGSCRPGEYAIDAKTLHDDFLWGRGRVVAEYMLAIEVGYGYAELAGAQFGGEQIRAPQQIGTVQGEAKADAEQLGGG